MKVPRIDISRTNPRAKLSGLPVRLLNAFAMAALTTESCYVFMELLAAEDGRSFETPRPDSAERS